MAAIQLSPGADKMAHYTLSNLEQLMTQIFNSSLATLRHFSNYYCNFQCMARWLLSNGKLYKNEACCLFQQDIPILLWAKLVCCLEITMLDHHLKDPYEVDSVFEAVK